MKKFFFSFIAVFAFLLVNAQSTGLIWKIKSNKIADSTYEITASTTVEQGWHLYGDNPTVEGLENVKLVYKLENITPVSELSFNKASSTIKDELFENKTINVYTDDVELKQIIKLKGFIPESFKVSGECQYCQGF